MRARQIKPGFFVDADLAACSPHARLLFPGLWCLADRAGRLEDRPRDIRAEVFPHEPSVDVSSLLDELAAARQDSEGGFILRYQAVVDRGRGPERRRFIQIRNFAAHQNTHPNERASEIPPPSREDTGALAPFPEHSHHFPSARAGSSGSSGSSGSAAACSEPATASAEPAETPPPPRANPSELDVARSELAQVLAELSALTHETEAALCLATSRTGRGKAFSRPADCRSLGWLRATRDQAEARLLAARQRAAALAAQERQWTPIPWTPIPEVTPEAEAEAVAAWEAVLRAIERELNRHSFATWFRPTAGTHLSGGGLVVRVPNRQFVDWLWRNYGGLIGGALAATGVAGHVLLDAGDGSDRARVDAAEGSQVAPVERAATEEPHGTSPTEVQPAAAHSARTPPARAAPARANFAALVAAAADAKLGSIVESARRPT